MTVVQEVYDSYRHGDLATMMAALRCPPRDLPDGGAALGRPRRGPEGAQEFFERLHFVVEATIETQEFVVAGKRVVHIGRSVVLRVLSAS
jgi:hypothetical protein